MIDRRQFLGGAGSAAAMLGGAAPFASPSRAFAATKTILPFDNGERPIVRYPQKRALIRHTARPPQLETPFSVFDESLITPNDAFFVRYHMTLSPPDGLDPDTYRIAVKGKVNAPLNLSLAALKSFPSIEIVAVNECSGNSRGFFNPRVAGGQLGNGAMGNARWKGVPLKTVLDKAGIQAGAKQVVFNGYDAPVLTQTPDFIKALDIDHARDGEVMLAYEMNGSELPVLNGYPVRLIVPGYYGTYWVKHVSEIIVIDSVFDGFWMKTAYRIPSNACACVPIRTKPQQTVPINRLNVRSFITNLGNGSRVSAGREVLVRGIAFDGGYGMSKVLLSADGGRNWRDTVLDQDLGRYSFRGWRTMVRLKRGVHDLMVKAINRTGQTQPAAPIWNPPGYMRNAIETVRVRAT